MPLTIPEVQSKGGYNIIYTDCPWTYNDKALAGNRGAGCKYDLMTDEEIYALPVNALAAKDCALFTWATMPKMQECLDAIKAWGFTYKTCAFTWIKTYPKSTHKYFIGMGRWTRSNAELCLLATKGKPKRINAGISQVIVSPIERHSKKPDIVREKIVQLCGDLPRLEMFARQPTNGWHIFGNEVSSDVILTQGA